MDKPKVYLKADASAIIGYGHFIRTLALADMLKDDFDCTFFTCHPTPYQVSEIEKVCPHVTLQEETHYDDFLSCLRGDEIVVLDNYFFTTDYQRAIKEKGCRLVCIDDMHDKHYVADYVINHGLTNQELFDCETYTKLCLGYEYALLRKPFLSKQTRAERNCIVVTFGGVDEFDITSKAILQLLDVTNEKIVAIVGDGYHPKNSFIDNERVIYRTKLSAQQMADTFNSASLVICSASSVCIEALACGAIIAAGWFVDNQKELYENLAKEGRIIPLGNIEKEIRISDVFLVSITPSTFDATRVKSHFLHIFSDLAKGRYLRKVRQEDLDRIYEWSNDPADRAGSFNSEPIIYENHIKWFAKLQTLKDVTLYVFIINREPVGQAKITLKGDGSAEVGYGIAANSRGKGLGNTIIPLVENEVFLYFHVTQMIAEVKSNNIPSLKIFSRNHYKKVKESEGIVLLSKELS